MRDAKDVTKISAANMAAIFRVRADAYFSDPPHLPPLRGYPKRRTIPVTR